MGVLFNFLNSIWQWIDSVAIGFANFYVDILNPAFWAIGNLFLAYTSVMLLLFVIVYFILFDPRATTGGKLIFQFMLSLGGVITLVFIGIYIDPSPDRSWNIIPITVEWWRPVFRLVIYGFVAYSISSLAALLVLRKWFPHKLKKASDLQLVQPRHTSEIPIVHPVTTSNVTTTESDE